VDAVKLFSYGKDGGPESTVWGYWLIEWKRLFSVALLCFEDGSREAFHTHAFSSVSWVLKGQLCEETIIGPPEYGIRLYLPYLPGLKPIFTSRRRLHKVSSVGRTWVLTFRGPWAKTWQEWLPKQRRFVTLTNGRQLVPQS
jgi:hypothetical protein